MREDVVHLKLVGAQVIHRCAHFLQAGHLLFPPFSRLYVHLLFRALPAAKGKDLLAFQLVDLAAHQVVQVPADLLYFPAVPICDGIFFQQVKILVRPVHKQNLILLTAKLFQVLFLFRPAVPKKAEIAADNQRIAFFQLAYPGILKPGHLPMHISGNIKQRASLLCPLSNCQL